MPEHEIGGEAIPSPGKRREGARALREKGFEILHTGTSISIRAPRSLWESVFGATFQCRQRQGREVCRPVGDLKIPADLRDLIEAVVIPEPPELF